MEDIQTHRCHLCPLTPDTAPRVLLERAPWMELCCGHRIHTNCFLEKAYNDNIPLLRFACPICQEHALANDMINWIRDHDVNGFHTPLQLQTLWDKDEDFRKDIKDMSKFQRNNSLIIKTHRGELAELRRQWKAAIYSSTEFIRLQKLEFIKRLKNLQSRKKAIQATNKIISKRRNLIAKYPSFTWYHFSMFHTIIGAPKMKKYSHYHDSILSPPRIFRVRI